MKKYIFSVLIALSVLLCACGNKVASDTSENSISVYRLLRPEYQTDGELLRSEEIYLNVGVDPFKEAASALNDTTGSDKLECPIPSGVIILDAVLKDNCVVVYMNSEYLDVTGINKSISDCCITLTMCSIENVDYVSICVGSEVITDKLSTEDFQLFNSITSSNTAQVRLYFPKSSGNTLGAEYHTVSFDEDNSAERYILDALLSGPTSSSLKHALPADTILLSVYTQDSLCTVSLSDFTSAIISPTSMDAELAVYSLVNSLTTIASIDSVQILIDGKQVQNIWGFDISHPLTRNESIIGSAVTE